MQTLPHSRALGLMGLLALFGLISVGCTPITPVPGGTIPPASAGSAAPLEGVAWQLIAYVDQSGATVQPNAPATLTFQAGRAGGSAGCNNFSANYTLAGDRLTIGQTQSTMMACPEPVMAQEQAVWGNLKQAASFTLVDGQLNILAQDGTTLLSFTQQVATPLTAVTWQAIGYNNGQQAVVSILTGSEVTASFGSDGMLTGSAGCNNYRAKYTLDGAAITIGPGITTRKLCGEPAGVMAQEAAYLAALTTAASYHLQGERLELRTAAGALVARFVANLNSN